MSRVLISSLPGELRLARLENGRLAELRIEYGRGGGETGDIHLGRVTSLDRKIKAAFCDIGQEEDAFLPLAGAPQGLSEGDLLPLVVMFAAAMLARMSGLGELAEILAGLLGLCAGFFWVKRQIKGRNPGIRVQTTEEYQ